ncbi:tyrosinase family protein [Chromobacterium subtsugae]|uniref:tyrosinase family protein n=2 Tax=Chromobacterium subtsugae TaxID=251747 RepID=UPI0006413FD1|nr:tyrosinase family protein [Chromobacterium subtsugae]
MTYERKSVMQLDGVWNDTMLWYAKAVREMMRRPITNPTSWRFQAAMHGFDRASWEDAGYLEPDEKLPHQTHWNQCQHQTWYFLPWHRGYIAAFEAIVRDAIVKLGGPADWALPYWNYSDDDNDFTRMLPQCFSERTLPDGAPNPLWVERRYGEYTVEGRIVLRRDLVNLQALDDAMFTSPRGKESVLSGFGGPCSKFRHSRRGWSGGLENKPHNGVHNAIGGTNPANNHIAGLMSSPITAALDPVFWIHHANIDRLWQVWLDMKDRGHHNPEDDNWLYGPPQKSDHKTFVMYQPDGSHYLFAPHDMVDLASPRLDYTYQKSHDPIPPDRLQRRSKQLRVRASQLESTQANAAASVELLGASQTELQLSGQSHQATVRIDPPSHAKMAQSYLALEQVSGQALTQDEPDRAFLRLDGIRTRRSDVLLRVFLEHPVDGSHLQVGVFSLFGANAAAHDAADHDDDGVSEVFEITDAIDQWHLDGHADLAELRVHIESNRPLSAAEDVRIEHIRLYRLGGN